MIKPLIYFWLVLIFVECSNNQRKKSEKQEVDSVKNELVIEENQWLKKKEELISLCIEKGDTVAFEKLIKDYYFHAPYHEFLNPAMIMANHYNYSGGYFFTYLTLSHPYAPKMNEKTECLAYYYLLKAYELKYPHAVSKVEEKFGNNKIPTASSYLVKMAGLP